MPDPIPATRHEAERAENVWNLETARNLLKLGGVITILTREHHRIDETPFALAGFTLRRHHYSDDMTDGSGFKKAGVYDAVVKRLGRTVMGHRFYEFENPTGFGARQDAPEQPADFGKDPFNDFELGGTAKHEISPGVEVEVRRIHSEKVPLDQLNRFSLARGITFRIVRPVARRSRRRRRRNLPVRNLWPHPKRPISFRSGTEAIGSM